MEEAVVCPWCHTEITWDEELGPEEYCPHCENELKGYRTIQLGGEEEADDELSLDDGLVSDELHDEEMLQEEDGSSSSEDTGFRRTNRTLLAYQATVERLLEKQEEVPECSSCREYMLETGRQTVQASEGYEPATVPGSDLALLPRPYVAVEYVCPTCFQVQHRVAIANRELLIRQLSEAADRD
ncbi:hypothetical protein [Paenibacillus daejeonensis]|uniref:hypothetical protein n=1 Tax=Paenibacillus daejeonensis TaxID=135193 RepID=UPI0003809606|nr:hypothetical protein [Paenibacillus daejeonensis]